MFKTSSISKSSKHISLAATVKKGEGIRVSFIKAGRVYYGIKGNH